MSTILDVCREHRPPGQRARYWILLDCLHWYKWDGFNPVTGKTSRLPKVGATFQCPYDFPVVDSPSGKV